jgi:hypothetical protein
MVTPNKLTTHPVCWTVFIMAIKYKCPITLWAVPDRQLET